MSISVNSTIHCSLCAAPCLLPRHPGPIPAHESVSLRSHALDSCYSSHIISRDTDNSTWEHQWHLLQISQGILRSFTLLSPTSSPFQEGNHEALSTKQRCAPIHAYCLDVVLKVIRKSLYIKSYGHEETVMLGWSIPKWTGYGPWVSGLTASDRDLNMGYWRGCETQRGRWVKGVEGSHLLDVSWRPFPVLLNIQVDHVSPIAIGRPSPSLLTSDTLISQDSALLKLPDSVLLHIIDSILEYPSPQDTEKSTLTHRPPDTSIPTLLTLLQTCTQLRNLILPSSIWKLITLNLIQQFNSSLLERWRASPTGVGSADHSSIALTEHFIEPVEQAFNAAGEDYEARDVWAWWAHGEGWRSRRRVWYCVIQGCATARDADWW
jgi:hypothetical protein